MSSANGLSPLQLWMQGMLANYNSSNRVADEMYGIQPNDYVSEQPMHMLPQGLATCS